MRSVCALVLLTVISIVSSDWASAQKIDRIGALVADDQFIPAVEGFKKRMAELGYVEGKS